MCWHQPRREVLQQVLHKEKLGGSPRERFLLHATCTGDLGALWCHKSARTFTPFKRKWWSCRRKSCPGRWWSRLTVQGAVEQQKIGAAASSVRQLRGCLTFCRVGDEVALSVGHLCAGHYFWHMVLWMHSSLLLWECPGSALPIAGAASSLRQWWEIE